MGGAIALGHPLGATGAIRVGDRRARAAAQEPEVRHGHDVRRHGAGRRGDFRAGLTPAPWTACCGGPERSGLSAGGDAMQTMSLESDRRHAACRAPVPSGRQPRRCTAASSSAARWACARTTTHPSRSGSPRRAGASPPSTIAASATPAAAAARCAASRPTCSTGRATIDARHRSRARRAARRCRSTCWATAWAHSCPAS